jgi:uncharacterized protein
MKILWDEPKRIVNLEKHGLDFESVFEFDWKGARITEARPSRHGGTRMKAVGKFDNQMAVVIFSFLGTEAISIISFRRASLREGKVQ